MENQNFKYNLPSFGRRFNAHLIDFAIVFAVSLPLNVIFQLVYYYFFHPEFFHTLNNGVHTKTTNEIQLFMYLVSAVTLIICYFTYNTYFHTVQNGQTVGKMVMRIRVIDCDSGRPLDFVHSMIRSLTKCFMFLVGPVVEATCFFSPQRRHLADNFSNSIVVTSDQKAPFMFPVNTALGIVSWIVIFTVCISLNIKNLSSQNNRDEGFRPASMAENSELIDETGSESTLSANPFIDKKVFESFLNKKSCVANFSEDDSMDRNSLCDCIKNYYTSNFKNNRNIASADDRGNYYSQLEKMYSICSDSKK